MNPTKTAIILVDDANDFLSAIGKLNSAVRHVVEINNVIENINDLVKRARDKGVVIMHVPLQFG